MYELLQMMQSFCKKLLQQKQEASIDQSPLQEIKLQHLEQVANLSTYPSQRFKSFCYDDNDDYDYEESTIPLNEIDSQIPSSIAITPVLLTLEPEDSLIMRNEDLSTILEKESDEFIKSSVEDLVLIPSESKDTSKSDSDYDLPSCDDFSPINVSKEKFVTLSNPLFDSNNDFTSSDDESLSDEDVPEDNVKIYSNLLFEFDDEYISSAVNPLFDEVLENIESKDSYVSNLDESALLVTPLSDFNEDECFDPGGDIDEIELLLHRDPSTPKISIVSILEGFTDEPPLEENDDLFNLESKTNDWKEIVYDAPIDDLMTKDKIFDPGGDIDEIDAFLDIDISMDIKDSYYDSEGDILYLESLLSDDTTPSPPPELFLDCDPRSLRDINDLKILVKVFDPGIHEKFFSPTYLIFDKLELVDLSSKEHYRSLFSWDRDFVMSDSEHPTVTYTSISNYYKEPSNIGSPGVVVYGYDRLPMHPPSPDYFIPPEDDVFPAAAVLPTTDSPGYITESDPKEDLKEEDDEDPKEDPTDCSVERDDDEEEEESSEDDADDEEEDEGDDDEE
ncbi:hypothetical protein Tco_1044400 [Tanacetum coccineum]|uniref:Reverse transcriptase domain-containing protein n=1 Tax=Tanacetum coccineum TaxID=301880 RepID=A0ABQ5GPT1_9ASTR